MQRYTEVPNYNQMQNYFEQCDDPYWKRIAEGLYYTAARESELIEIKDTDVIIEEKDSDFVNITLHTKKNPHAPIRFIPINRNKEPQWINVFFGGGLLFTPLKSNWKTTTFLRIMRKRFNEFWGVAPHYFRHCRLTHMVTQFDFNDQELVKYAGWSDSKPAKWYMSLKTQDLQRKMK